MNTSACVANVAKQSQGMIQYTNSSYGFCRMGWRKDGGGMRAGILQKQFKHVQIFKVHFSLLIRMLISGLSAPWPHEWGHPWPHEWGHPWPHKWGHPWPHKWGHPWPTYAGANTLAPAFDAASTS